MASSSQSITPVQPTGLSHHDPLLDDLEARNTRLASERDRLFTSDISIDVLSVVDRKVHKATFTDNAEFESCLERPAVGNRYYILKPSRPKVVSRCPLHVSEDITRKLLGTHKVMPSFLDHIHAYGRREKREQDASFGGGRYKLGYSVDEVTKFELCYTVKFGVNNGRKEPSSPYAWSIRQSSVYQKFQYNEKKSVWILLQPSESVQPRLIAAAPNDSSENPLKMHLLFFSAASEGWRSYYNHLEKIFFETTKAAVNFSVQRSDERYPPQGPAQFVGRRDPLEQFQVDFQDVQDLQRLEELLRRIQTALEINEDSIRSLKALNTKLRELTASTANGMSLSSWSEVDIEAEQQLAIIAGHKRNFQMLLENVHGRAQLLYNVLDFRNALTVSHTSQRAVDIRHLQMNESAMMTMLNEMSMRDAIGVKILTLLATLYVPASFVATFLGAGVITFDKSRSDRKSVDFKRMAVSRETMIFYLIFTVLLMAITYGCWWLWARKAYRSVEVKLSVSRANSMEPEKMVMARIGSGLSTNSAPRMAMPRQPPQTPRTQMSPMSPMSPMSF